MGWNGSGGKKTAEQPNQTRKPAWRNGLVAGLIVVIGAAIAAYFIFSGAPEHVRSEEAKKKGLIQEVTPAAAHKAEGPVEEVVAEPEKPIDPNARPTRVGEELNGYVLLPSGRLHRRVGIITNSVGLRAKAPYAIFKHHCNNELACYLSLQPGDVLVGTRRYTGTFKDEFLKSIETPIVVTDDDTPEVAQLKRDVIEARLQLKDALDRGEDIEQIMIDTRTELQDMMRVKNAIQHLFNEEVMKCETMQDVDDVLEASNQMLAEKGIAPLKCGPVTKMNILRDLRERRGEPIDDEPESQGGTEK